MKSAIRLGKTLISTDIGRLWAGEFLPPTDPSEAAGRFPEERARPSGGRVLDLPEYSEDFTFQKQCNEAWRKAEEEIAVPERIVCRGRMPAASYARNGIINNLGDSVCVQRS